MSATFADPRDANFVASANQDHSSTLAADYAHLGIRTNRTDAHDAPDPVGPTDRTTDPEQRP